MNLRSQTISYIAIDVESTGLDPRLDRIVEIAAVRFDASGEETSRFDTLVRPGGSIPEAATAIHGINDGHLESAPSPDQVLPRFMEFLGDPVNSLLIAHNASKDAGFIGAELRRAGLKLPRHRVVDTLALARRLHPEFHRHRLDSLAHRLGLNPQLSHRALPDASCLKEIWLKLGGALVPEEVWISYPIHDPELGFPVPHGYQPLQEAIECRQALHISYQGGSRGLAPRTITPGRFELKGGEPYVLAFCHLSRKDKYFRLDRIRICQAQV